MGGSYAESLEWFEIKPLKDNFANETELKALAFLQGSALRKTIFYQAFLVFWRLRLIAKSFPATTMCQCSHIILVLR